MLKRKHGAVYLYKKPAPSKMNADQPAEKEGFHEKALFEQLFEASPDGNIVVDEQGRIVMLNQRSAKMFGYATDELIGQNIEILVPDARRVDHQQYREGYLRSPSPRSMALRQSLQLELAAQRKDGSTFPVEITLNPVRSESSLYILSIVRDVTERKQREREAQQQNELVRLLQDIAIAANEATTVQSAVQYTLDRLRGYLGWPLGHALVLEEDESLSPMMVWSGEQKDSYVVFRAVSDAMRFLPGEGLPGSVLESAQPIWLNNIVDNPSFMRGPEASDAGLRTALGIPVLAGKRVMAVLEFFHDVDISPDPNLIAILPHVGVQLGRVIERASSEQALRQQAAQLRMVMTNLPVILWVIDREGKLLLLEGKGIAGTGLNPENLLGKNIFTEMSTRPDLMELFQRALKGEAVHAEIDSNRGVAFEVFFTPYYDVNWAVDGMIGLSIDINERKAMESELDEMRRRLQDSMDIERARLAQQLHDGPLQDLYGAFYQIQEVRALLDEPNQEVAGRALQTIQGVNATLRVICGELHPNTLVHLGLQRAIRGHAERLQERMPEKVILLDLADDRHDGAEGQISHTVRLGLYRVYQQMIDNAVQHSGGQHIWVRLKLLPDRVVLEVQDNGQGFQVPTHWVEMLRENRYGLASAMERMRALQGSLEITSRPGEGTLARATAPRK